VIAEPIKVHKSWALVRDISTALIVIAALVMILRRPSAFGPSTLTRSERCCPRIVAAVILMQISWEGVRYR